MTLSISLATFNEEKNITLCLESVKEIADEIVIVDGNSADNTAKIAKGKFSAKVISVPNNPQFHVNKQISLDNCTGDWILQLDADEALSPKLIEEIKEVVRENRQGCNGYYLPRSNFFLGRFLTKGGAYPDPVLRLFKKGTASFHSEKIVDNSITTSNVHAQIQVEGKVGYLKNDLIHNGDPRLDRYLSRLNRYTSLEAENLVALGMKPSFTKMVSYMLIKPTYWFGKRYFRHRGYVDGLQGFLFALLSAMHYPVIYLKVWELHK